MNKDQLEKEAVKYKKLYDSEKKNSDFLLKQQRELKSMAEKAGSELAPYKAMVMRLEEELEKLKSILKNR